MIQCKKIWKKGINLLVLILLFESNAMTQNYEHAELLGRPTDHSITVQLFFNKTIEACVQYGTSSGNYTDQTSWQLFNNGDPTEIIILGLNPNTKYFYRVCYRDPGSMVVQTRAEYFFHTQRPEGSSFSFVVQADPHMDEQSDSAVYNRCLRNQLEDQPDFMIDLGDIWMTDKLKNSTNRITHDTITKRCRSMRSYYETSGHSVPLFMALGNHEGESGWNLNGIAENIAVWSTLDRKKYFNNPYPDGFYTGDQMSHNFVGLRENYYAWTWGDATFIVLDPYWYTSPKPDSLHGWRWTLGKQQYDWLKSTLEQSKSTFKFVFAHQLVGGDPDGRGGIEFADYYEWGGKNLDGTDGFAINRPGWYKPIKDLLTEYKVNIFFHGHDHFFGKQEKDCLFYQETPQPSHPNFTNNKLAADYGYLKGQFLPNSGHIRVTVNPDLVKVEYVRVYTPNNETNNRKNKDVSASYFIGAKNCYDSISTGSTVVWNNNYIEELIYPNPFNEQTRIELNLSTARNITVDIFNSNGRLVNTLLKNRKLQEGNFSLIWDGKDVSGAKLPKGIYYYQIRDDKGEVNSGKIELL